MTGRAVTVEADGGSRGNPGPAGYGAVVRDADTGEVLAERYGALGVTTNNVAEYTGLLEGLAAAADLGAARVAVRMDSKLVVEQMSGRWQIRNPGLRPLAAKAAGLVGRFAEVTFEWIPRERNRAADALANRAMDEAAGRPAAGAAGRRGGGAEAGGDAAPGPGRSPRSWAPPTLEAATRFVLVRHGETELTAQGRYSGRGDVPLAPRGEQQARAAAHRVAAVTPQVAAVVSSPLARCRRTAELIAERVGGVPVTVEPGLVECDFGAWEGLTFREVERRWPDEMAAWLASPDAAPPDGESFRQVAARVREVMTVLRGTHPRSAVVVVSHVSPIKLVLQEALDASDAFLHRLFLDPAGVSVVDTWPDGGVAVRTVNDTAHLG